jgi:hypothetical protein
MPPPLLWLLPPLVNGRSAAAAAVLLPPGPPACFYGGAALAMYQSSMTKRCAGSSAMTDALLLDQHSDNVEAQHRRHRPPRHLPRQQQIPHRRHRYQPLVIVLAGPTTVSKSNIAALLCLPCLALESSVGHHLAWEGANEVKEEEEEEHAKDGTNDELANPTADDSARRNRRCKHRPTMAVAAVAAIAVRSGHVVSANLVRAYRCVDIGSNKPTDFELWCTPHHLLSSLLKRHHIVQYDTLFLKQNIPSMIILPTYVGIP